MLVQAVDLRRTIASAVSSASSMAAPIAPHQAQNGGTISCDSSSSNVSRSASTTPSLLATAPMKQDRRLDGAALDHAALEVLRDRAAQPAENLGRRAALLLRVDHVGLGEDRAAARDARRRALGPHDVAHLLDRVAHPRRLLIEERPGAGRALAAAVVVGDQRRPARRHRLQAEVARTLAADLEHRPDVRVERGHHVRGGLELVLVVDAEDAGDRPAARAGDADALDVAFRHRLVEGVQHVVGGLDRAARDADVVGHDERVRTTRRPGGSPAAPRTAPRAAGGPRACRARPASARWRRCRVRC